MTTVTESARTHARIPLEVPDTLFGKAVAWYMRRTYGKLLDPGLALLHNKDVLKGVLTFEKKVAKWDSLDTDLKVLAELVSAATIGCSWCVDFGYYVGHSKGLDVRKLEKALTWREHRAEFTRTEQLVMEYAEAMTATPPAVTDELAAELRRELGDEAFVELTMMIAVENQRSRVNSALGLTSQGFKESCDLR